MPLLLLSLGFAVMYVIMPPAADVTCTGGEESSSAAGSDGDGRGVLCRGSGVVGVGGEETAGRTLRALAGVSCRGMVDLIPFYLIFLLFCVIRYAAATQWFGRSWFSVECE